ncbi:MAG: hypothetical protein EOO38_31120 [Cytophagaceae bacterium]|nr:MAG: hypothetical protein EOO38_31120 [Cytophagaceae bacterium]
MRKGAASTVAKSSVGQLFVLPSAKLRALQQGPLAIMGKPFAASFVDQKLESETKDSSKNMSDGNTVDMLKDETKRIGDQKAENHFNLVYIELRWAKKCKSIPPGTPTELPKLSKR